MDDCRKYLSSQGKTVERTCRRCGIGPCQRAVIPQHPFDDQHGILGFSDKAPPRRLDFAGAVAALHEGRRVARECWSPSHIIIRVSGSYIEVRGPEVCGYPRVSEWAPTPEQLNATDWMIVL